MTQSPPDPAGSPPDRPTGRPYPDRPGDGPDQGPDREPGRIRSTPPGAVMGFAVAGLVLGWLVRPVSTRLNGIAPTVGWLPVVTLGFAAVVVATLAWATHRQLHRRHELLAPHAAVNRLVLGKAGALAGAFVAGGYFGYALSFLGVTDVLDRGRVLHALLAGAAATLLAVASLLLEHACRVRRR